MVVGLAKSTILCFIKWTATSEFGTYRLCEQRRFRRARAVSPETTLLAHTSSESRGTFRQKTRSLAPLNGWACAIKICHDGMLEDTNSLDGAQIVINLIFMLLLWCIVWVRIGSHCANRTFQVFLYSKLHRDPGWSMLTVTVLYTPDSLCYWPF